jgi:plastocyanin
MTAQLQSRHSFSRWFCMAALVTSACGASTSESIPLSAGPNEVVIGEAVTFSPAHLTVPAGTTVHWRNAGPFGHTVTSGASSKPADRPGADFDANLPAGGTFDFTFADVGDHPYFCRPHESMGMKGIITVTPASAKDAGAQPDSSDTSY